MKTLLYPILASALLLGCAEEKTQSVPIVKGEDEGPVTVYDHTDIQKEGLFTENQLIGVWEANWMNDPSGVGSTSFYQFKPDGYFQTWGPGKPQGKGKWWLGYRGNEQCLFIEMSTSYDHGLDAITECPLEYVDKSTFDVKRWISKEVLTSSNHIRFTRNASGE